MKILLSIALLGLCLSAHGQAVRNLNGAATNLTLWGTNTLNGSLTVSNGISIIHDASTGAFYNTVGQFTFESVVDDMQFWGYNYGLFGDPVDDTLPNIGMQFEANFRSGGNNYSEWSINTTSLTNGTYRWAGLIVDRNNPTNGLSAWNFDIGTVGSSAFNIVRARDQIIMARVLPTGILFVLTGLESPLIQSPIGQALLMRGGATGFVYVRQDISGISFGAGANSTISQAANISSLNLTIGAVTPASITLNTNGNVGIGASSAVPAARLSVSGAGIFTNGIASYSDTAVVTIAATGWTNIWATNNAIVHFDGTAMFFTNVLRGNTPWYTNTTAHTGAMTVTLQPSEAIRIAGTSVVGRAKPF